MLEIWRPKASQLVLTCTGAGAWLVAVILALCSKGEAVATAFVVAGAPLIAGAAFYARVRKITRDGIELDPGVLGELFVRLPQPPEGVSALEERRSVIEAVEAVAAPPAPLELEDDVVYIQASVERGVESYERSQQLESAAQAWLAHEGYEMQPAVADRGTDFIARRGGGVYAFEVKSSRGGAGGPTPEALRAYFLQARVWVDSNLGEGEPFYRVLITDVVPPPSLRDRYRSEWIGIVLIEPKDGLADWVLEPRDTRKRP